MKTVMASKRPSEAARVKRFPGIAFRDAVAGREAYVSGHRVAVWEVVATHAELKTAAKTARHFRWPVELVRQAMAYAKAFPTEVSRHGQAETGDSRFFSLLLQSVKEAVAIERGEMKAGRVFNPELALARRGGK